MAIHDKVNGPVENEVRMEDVPEGAVCHDCGLKIAKAQAFATYTRHGQKFYKCAECYEHDPLLRRKCEVYSRVVGYLRPVENWNDQKQREFKDRKPFKAPPIRE